jgi:uncharacterized protein YndB with AHSA1/START domain
MTRSNIPNMIMPPEITVTATIDAPVEKAWEYFTDPKHIVSWNAASEDWHTPKAENDLRPGGMFNYRMEAKDGSYGFDFSGTYSEVVPHQSIVYAIGDGRKARVTFEGAGDRTQIAETFEAETENPLEMQKDGWQAILDNFKKYTETRVRDTMPI